jgi:hypothetical protein
MKTKLLAALAVCQAGIASAALPPTVDATFPLEVLAVDPAIATGNIPGTLSSPRLAMQPARPARGVVRSDRQGVLLLALLKPVEKTAAGTARLDGPPDRIAWCELPSFMSLGVFCYQDLDADGNFETSRNGIWGTDEVLALSRLQEPKSIDPVAYRAAETTELPLFHVGYRQCGSTRKQPQTLDGEMRFETVVRRAEGLQWPKSGRCDNLAKLLETRPDGSRLFQMGRFKVEVSAEQPSGFATRLVEGMPPGTLLAHVRTSWPLIDATELPPDSDAISGAIPYLVAVGDPRIASHAAAGEEVLSLEVRHGLTAKLAVNSEPGAGWGDKVLLEAGTPLYGVAMGSSLKPLQDAEVVWCTPLKLGDKPTEAYCLVPNLGGATLVRAYSDPFTVTGVSVSGKQRNAPVVERGPVDFGAPLDLLIKVKEADKKSVSITWSLAPRGQQYEQAAGLRRAKDDSGYVLIGEMLLKIKPSPDGKSFEISTIGQLAAGDGLYLPRDAARLR